jgi:hypothetical protein
MLQRTLHFSFLAFLRRACVRPLLTGLLLSVSIVGIRMVGRPENPAQLAVQGVLAGTAAALAVFGVGITAGERERYVVHPFRRWALRQRQPAEVGRA